MTTKALHQIYQLKISLEGAKPPIWRRVLVSSDMRLDKLHGVIQITMGWMNSHLHQFVSGQQFYGRVDDEFGIDLGPEVEDESEYRLSDLLKREKGSMIYEYDFGDGWMHKVLLEKKLPDDKAIKLPQCVKGKRACPPEDCGGVWGYEELQEVLKDPKHPEYEEMMEWLGLEEEFDPEEFNLEQINETLERYFK